MARTPYQQWVPKADETVDDGDFNAACSMLYRWWSLFEAPAGTDTSSFYDGLLDEQVHVQMPDCGHRHHRAPAFREGGVCVAADTKRAAQCSR